MKYEEIKNRIETLSGSGFDSKWDITDKGRYVKCFSEWHLMNEDGYYIGYYGFTVIIPKKNPIDFRLYGWKDNKRIFIRYGIWDYLKECIANVFDND